MTFVGTRRGDARRARLWHAWLPWTHAQHQSSTYLVVCRSASACQPVLGRRISVLTAEP